MGEIRHRIAAGFSASSLVLAVFALIFIWYSNSFFTRKRKKEIGLYSLLGIKKRQIGRLLFYENIIMGIAALIIGILLGSLLSKLFVMLLVRLMEFAVPVQLSIIPEAIYSTLKVFAVLFTLTSIHGYLIIYRFKLADLFKAEKKAEKEPGASVIKAVLSVLLILGGYVFYTYSKVNFLYLLLITLISVVVGTFLLFSSLSVFLIKMARRNKKKYYKGTNMISVSNLLHRIKGHARTLALIAVLSATTLTAMSVTASVYYYFKTTLDYVAPFSYSYLTTNQGLTEDLEGEVREIISRNPSHQLEDMLEFSVLRIEADMPTGVHGEYSTHRTFLMRESTYNMIADLRGIERVSLDYDRQCFLIDEYYNEVFRESYQGKTIKIHNQSADFNLEVKDFTEKPIVNLGILYRTIIIKDRLYNQLYTEKSTTGGVAFDVTNERNSKELTDQLSALFKERTAENGTWQIWYQTYYNYYQVGVTQFGQSIFIGAFLGLVFLISTGSIIFFKLLSEASEEGLKYKTLKNIGVSCREIRTLLKKQILFFFAAPLLIGIMHSLVAVSILERLLSLDLTIPVIVTIVCYAGIYMAYYFFTVNSYIKNINLK
ncbi:MAG: FtsX-like permease family protein [Halanaerobiales bacterium]